MVNQQLLDYIKSQLQAGIEKEKIKESLRQVGWREEDIEEGFNSINSSTPSVIPESITTHQFSATLQQPERKRNKILLATISVLSMLIIGGGVFGYFYYFRETPEKVIEEMKIHLAGVKAFEYRGKIKTEITTSNLLGGGNFIQPTQQIPSKKTSNFSINFNGKVDTSDPSNPKGSLTFNIKTDALKKMTQRESVFGLEVRVINKIIYVKLNNLSNLGFVDLRFLSNQWIKIDTKTVKKQSGFEKPEGQIGKERKQQKLNSEQLKKLKQAVIQAKILKVTEKLASEKIEGVNTHHYKFSIDKNELKKLVVNTNEIVQSKTLTDEDLTKLDKELKAIKSLEGEIWVGKKDYLPYKILFIIRTKKATESKTVKQLTATLLFKNYNKPVQVDIPSPVKDIKEILGQLFGKSWNSARLSKPQSSLQLPAR